MYCKCFKLKKYSHGNPIKYKARLVAEGFGQKRRICYEETFTRWKFFNNKIVFGIIHNIQAEKRHRCQEHIPLWITEGRNIQEIISLI